MQIAEFREELVSNILPFWMDKMWDNEHGGFYGQIDGCNRLQAKSNKGAVLNARILWTFSAAYRILGDDRYKVVADRAYAYIKKYFIDPVHGGVFWELDYRGNPVNTKKQIYAQGFALYGFSEYYRATGIKEALDLAKTFFGLIEQTSDKEYGGYFEAFTENWHPIPDMRLSEKDANEKKSMNTHLHVLEPYTNLCRIWKDPKLHEAQHKLIRIFLDKIVDLPSNHLQLFFNETWRVKSTAISYGHDIEASWLLIEAAEALGDTILYEEVLSLSEKIAKSALSGIQSDGSLAYEKKGLHIDTERHWWVQAEALVGSLYVHSRTKDPYYKEKAEQIWAYIQRYLVDRKHGEWYWSRLPNGEINRKDDKAGFWKCPYHNARMCMEAMTQICRESTITKFPY